MSIEGEIMKIRAYILFFVFSLFALSGSVTAAEAKDVTISVSRNDSLIEICRKYLKQPEKWQQIAKNNRLANPNRLSPGQKISIPVDMLKALPMDGRVTFIKGRAACKTSTAEWSPLGHGDIVKTGSYESS